MAGSGDAETEEEGGGDGSCEGEEREVVESGVG
jgi:hypothetical protein